MELKLTKIYYSIGEVASLFGVSQSLLRYWETEFPVLKPQKNRKGDRRYTQKDVQLVADIYKLVKQEGYTLEGARKALESKTRKPEDDQKLKNNLMAIKRKLDDLLAELDGH